MKKIIYYLFFLLFLFSCSDKNNTDKKTSEKPFNIGISEIIAHPSLDLVVDGIKESLKDKNVNIELKVANGDLSQANLIASSFKSSGKNVVIGIGTGAAQALNNNIKEVPVLYGAVSDPELAGLVNKNVTGVSDKLNTVSEQLKLLKEKFPNVKSIGVLYSTSELNSASQLKDIEKAAKELNLEVIKGGATNSGDLFQVVNTVVKRADALYIPTDNLLVSNMKYVVDAANKEKKPLVASEKSSVEIGALFAIGIDYYELGKELGNMVKQILEGTEVSNIDAQISQKTSLYVNEKTAKLLNVSFEDRK